MTTAPRSIQRVMTRAHEITEHVTPIGHLLRCKCGWSHTVPRQNALARAAKVRRAIREHREQGEAK
jgi:hypothetical protein